MEVLAFAVPFGSEREEGMSEKEDAPMAGVQTDTSLTGQSGLTAVAARRTQLFCEPALSSCSSSMMQTGLVPCGKQERGNQTRIVEERQQSLSAEALVGQQLFCTRHKGVDTPFRRTKKGAWRVQKVWAGAPM